MRRGGWSESKNSRGESPTGTEDGASPKISFRQALAKTRSQKLRQVFFRLLHPAVSYDTVEKIGPIKRGRNGAFRR